MLCLAFDTASARLTVAVGTAERVLAAADVWAPRDHMARLLSLVDRMLCDAGAPALADLDAIVVGIGPGSFTGVRIGVAVAKGIARGAGLPLFGVPSLDAVAEGLGCMDRPTVVIADAARGEVYPMTYGPAGGSSRGARPFRVLDASEFAQELAKEAATRAWPSPPILAGDGLVKHRAVFEEAIPGVAIAPEPRWYPTAEAMLRLAGAAAEDQTGDPDTVLPIYTRASDAEEAAARRGGGPSGPAGKGAAGKGAAGKDRR